MTQKRLLQNIPQLVEQGFCVGCGLCVAMCPEDAAHMTWNQYGAYEPRHPESCAGCQACMQVCPFADGVLEGVNNPTEDEIGAALFAPEGSQHDPYVGYYNGCMAGYAPEYRLQSTSGGIASWVLNHLLETGKVDRVICVAPGSSNEALFEYRVFDSAEAVRSGARSRYYPVHLAEALKIVQHENARYALVGIPCVIKGVRLAQRQDARLRERIVFTIGIFCGGLKTAHFTEYLAAQIGIGKDEIKRPEYRIKHEGHGSPFYHFGCADPEDDSKMREFSVKRLKDLWGPGFFKPHVCDYCDDVVGETADLSAGDAWIKPYTDDWRGTNLVITRSRLAQEVIAAGMAANELTLEPVPTKKVLLSQKGNFEHRRRGLAYRLYWAGNRPTPRKRVQPERPANLLQAKIYRQKMSVRAKSHTAWLQQRHTPGTQIFDRLMGRDINSLRRWQYIDRLVRKVLKRK